MQKRRKRAGDVPQAITRADGGAATTLGRRTFLRGTLAGLAGVVLGVPLSGCSDSSAGRMNDATAASTAPPLATGRVDGTAQPTATGSMDGTAQPTATGSTVLLAYFSRAGENYYYGERTQLTVGNTEVLAGMISQLIGCDVYRIDPVEPYPDDYEETVARNVREQEADARPAIANPLASIASYTTVLLGSPIWNVRAPMIMTTFVDGFDFTGKTVVPFVTYAVSGLGTTVRDYTAACPGATIAEGLAVRGEEVGEAGAAVETWLRRIALLT
jgi:flavodoxin